MKKDTVRTLRDAARNAEKTFEKAVSDAAGKSASPNDDSSDGQPFRDADKAGSDDITTGTDAARDERGIPSQKWKEVKDKADEVREDVAKVEQTGRFFWLKVLAGIAAVGFGFSTLSTPNVISRNQQIYDQQLLEQARISASQFNIMVGGLTVRSAAPASLPAEVAAVAHESVEVEVTTSSGTRTYPSTIGQVYQNVPQARQTIEQNPRRDQGFHKDFTVSSPVGSAHFRY